jgi:hypothetical protein
MSTSDEYDDLLKTIYWVGWIMLATPILMALPPFLYGVITGQSFGGFLVDGGEYATGSITITGLVIMIYTSIKMARRKPSDKTKSKQASHRVVSST